jgi:hypothetical protein
MRRDSRVSFEERNSLVDLASTGFHLQPVKLSLISSAVLQRELPCHLIDFDCGKSPSHLCVFVFCFLFFRVIQ